MTDATQRRPKPCAWAMRIPGCDGSADWVELGEQEPVPCPPAVAHPLYDQSAIDRLIADRDSWMQQASDRAHEEVQKRAEFLDRPHPEGASRKGSLPTAPQTGD